MGNIERRILFCKANSTNDKRKGSPIACQIKERTGMPSLSFTTAPQAEWDKKIRAGVLKECEVLTGSSQDFKTHAIYIQRGVAFIGGIIFEQHGDILWIDSIWIKKSFRKQGLGRKILQKIELFATQCKAKELQLNTYFEKAHSFFLTCEFEDVAIIPNWKWGLTCYLMRKLV